MAGALAALTAGAAYYGFNYGACCAPPIFCPSSSAFSCCSCCAFHSSTSSTRCEKPVRSSAICQKRISPCGPSASPTSVRAVISLRRPHLRVYALRRGEPCIGRRGLSAARAGNCLRRAVRRRHVPGMLSRGDMRRRSARTELHLGDSCAHDDPGRAPAAHIPGRNASAQPAAEGNRQVALAQSGSSVTAGRYEFFS